MLNYWWVTRPKRRLDSIPEVLAAFADISLNQEWQGQRGTQLKYEEALEKAGLKRVGIRRDQSGSGARTYQAWLESLGLIFHQHQTRQIKLTLAGEAIMNGDSPVDVLKWQVLKYQFPSSFSLSRGVQVNPRFRIHPFVFLLRLLSDSRIEYLTQEEIAKIVIEEADRETDKCYEYIVKRIIDFRTYGDSCLASDFFEEYKPSKGRINSDHPYQYLTDIANTFINWIEYTQLAKRNEKKQLVILDDKRNEVNDVLSMKLPFIDRPEEHEFFQRKYGLDPKHHKDTRNLEKTKTITEKIIAEMKIKQAYISIAMKKPIIGITPGLIQEISDTTGIMDSLVEDIIQKNYPHGSIGAFMASYFEMAFKGTEEAVDFEKATTELFQEVFGYKAIHLGQTGSKSAPDILLISDSEGYQSIIDNKAYSKYSITGDHHNRMVHNYLAKIGTYSSCSYPIGYFSYIAGGFAKTIDKQIQDEVRESGVHGSGITVSNFIKMVENQTTGKKVYSHAELRRIFGVDRQIRLSDISGSISSYTHGESENALRRAADNPLKYGDK